MHNDNENEESSYIKKSHVILIVMAVFGAMGISMLMQHEKEEKQIEAMQDEWCEVGVIQNGNLSYASTKQQEELMVIARANGLPVLMAKCDRDSR